MLCKLMWEDGGILRNQEGLARALATIKEMFRGSLSSSAEHRSGEVRNVIELRSATRVAALILEGALRRSESRGAHFREDFPKQDDDNWRGHLQVHLTSNGDEVWHFQPE